MRLELIRVGQSARGTFGVLRHQEVPFVLTLERPWKHNIQEVSCIPAGPYRCRRVRSPRFGDTYEVMEVPERSHILFHAGNTTEDTQGCILVAEEFSGTWAKPMVVASRRGFNEFLDYLNGAPAFELLILDPPPVPVAPVSV